MRKKIVYLYSLLQHYKNNYMHAQAMMNIPINLGYGYMNIFGTASIDKRNVDKFNLNFSKLINNDDANSIFNLSSGVNISISNRSVDIFGQYVYRDFLHLNHERNLNKIKNSSLMFGLQYNL